MFMIPMLDLLLVVVVFIHQVLSDLCDPVDCSTLGSSVLYYLPEFTHIPVHWVGDAIIYDHLIPEAAFSFCLQSFPASEIFCYHSTDLSDSAYFFFFQFIFFLLWRLGHFQLSVFNFIHSFIPCYLQTTLELILWVFISVVVSFSLITSNLLFL